ncbi:glucan endo-1,3-beta-glucosidase 8-like [Impatiens glandulifera]|uniref:glucan endo-1,3-beta-glucosidase 8-like n=1 Tax=Impatiens glandulifera TaxID=253017 RepID=UPI001FB05786|nr:glucan endo-1,3-beta-glucosidase 8-like [Impatiens glandulifera]
MAMAVTMAIFLALCIAFVAFSDRVVVTAIGINYGTHASHTLPIDIIVKLCQDNMFHKVKLFDANPKTIEAFVSSNIELTIAIRNTDLERIAGSYSEALTWVHVHVNSYAVHGGVNIKYVAVGNEPFSKRYNGIYLNSTLPAIKNIQKALTESGKEHIKVITPLNSDIYQGNVPSAGNFRSDIKPQIIELIKFLQSVNSPFFINISPFNSYHRGEISIDYAMLDGNSNVTNSSSSLNDKGMIYENALDASLDTLISSIKNATLPTTMDIIVGGIGWPTDGDQMANSYLAKRFYDGLIKKAATKKGTPLGLIPLEYYGFSLIDENFRTIETGNFERHWGVFTFDGQPKFETKFFGNSLLVEAKGVKYLSPSFCMMNPNVNDYSLLADNLVFACEFADCTQLNYGGSCNNYDEIGNATYVFNMYYQMHGQDPDACIFNGLGTITLVDPTSEETCPLMLQIVSSADRRMIIRSVVLGVLVFVVELLF